MARTISEIKKEMTDRFVTDEVVVTSYGLQPGKSFEESFSTVSVENIFFYIVAFCSWTVEVLFDVFRAEVNDTIATQKPHTLKWYTEKAKAFQYGSDLLPDSDLYDNTNKTDDEIAASKVIKYAACMQRARQNGRKYLLIKIAGETGGELSKVSPDTELKVNEYFSRIADAGVDYEVLNEEADSIRQTWTIYYNPLLFDEKGQLGDSTPIKNAIINYLKNLPFNGTYVPAYHIDAVQQVEGVVYPVLNQCQVKYGNYDFGSISDFSVNGRPDEYVPDSGYMRFKTITDDDITSDLIINYKPHAPIL
jgi:hypothetical protein